VRGPCLETALQECILRAAVPRSIREPGRQNTPW
jgi:hypothetical protein